MTAHRMTDSFTPRSEKDVARLIERHPLAWIVSRDGDDSRATLLPLQAVADAAGRIERLVGHFARSNAHVDSLRGEPRAIILFLGPHGYISPSWIHDRTWAPTWNYASVQFVADVEFRDDAAILDRHLRDLVAAMERGRPGAWNPDEMGERYRKLSAHVVAFVAHVRAERPRFKLGQDERDAVYKDITVGLRQSGAQDLLRWMADFNPQRES